MPQFAFVAKDQKGNTVQGTLPAADLAFAANQIGQMGYSLVDLQPVTLPFPADTAADSAPAGDTQSSVTAAASPAAPPPQAATPEQPTQSIPAQSADSPPTD